THDAVRESVGQEEWKAFPAAWRSTDRPSSRSPRTRGAPARPRALPTRSRSRNPGLRQFSGERRSAWQTRRPCRPFVRALRCGAQAEPAERVAIQPGFFIQLAAVTVAAAVFLINRDVQPCTSGKSGNWLRALEDGAMLGVA